MSLAPFVIFNDTYLERIQFLILYREWINGWRDGCYLIHPIGNDFFFLHFPHNLCLCYYEVGGRETKWYKMLSF